MHIEIRLIRQAQALASHGSISRAAAALGIAQPTLSRSIKELEARIGLALFSRHQHGVTPTDFGQMFLQQAALVAAQVADLEREVALVKGLQTGEVALGVGPYAAEALVPICLRRFSAAHPSVRLRMLMDAPDVLVRHLRTRHLDLVVAEASMLEADDALEIMVRLSPIAGFVMARAGHPLASKSRVSLAEVLDYPFAQVVRLPPRLLKPMLSQRRTIRRTDGALPPPFPAFECPTVRLAASAIMESNATMIASLGMLRPELERGLVVPLLHEPWMRSDWAIVRVLTRSLGPAAIALVAELQRAHEDACREDAELWKRWGPAPRSQDLRTAPGARSRRASTARS